MATLRKRITIPSGPWAPDRGAYNPPNQGFVDVQNIAPTDFGYSGQYKFAKTETTYNPTLEVHDITSTNIQLPNTVFITTYEVYDAVFGVDCVNEHIFLGGHLSLYHNGEVNGAQSYTYFDDVSTGAYAGYGFEYGNQWRFCRFGKYVLATDYIDDLQIFDLSAHTGAGTTNFAAITPVSGGADPHARHIIAFRQNVFLADIYLGAPLDGYSGAIEDMVLISGDYNPEAWGSAQSTPHIDGTGYLLIRDSHGRITGMASNELSLYVFKADAIYRLDGPPYTAYQIASGVGTRFGNAITTGNGAIYFWSQYGPTRLMNDQIEYIGADGWSKVVSNRVHEVPASPVWAQPRPYYTETHDKVTTGVMTACYDRSTNNVLFGFNSKLRYMDLTTAGLQETRFCISSGIDTGITVGREVYADSYCDALLAINTTNGLTSYSYPLNVKAQYAGTTNCFGFRSLFWREKYQNPGCIFRSSSSWDVASSTQEMQFGSLAVNGGWDASVVVDGDYPKVIDPLSSTAKNPVTLTTPFFSSEGSLPLRIRKVRPLFAGPTGYDFGFATTGTTKPIGTMKVLSKATNFNKHHVVTSDGIDPEGWFLINNDDRAKYKAIHFEFYNPQTFSTITNVTAIQFPGTFIGFEVELETEGQGRSK